MTLSVGDSAPAFSLPDQDKQSVSLADLRGTPVLLVFYPFAFSGICTGELCQLRDEFSSYDSDVVQVLGVSVDTSFSLKAWADQQGYQFPLLSDFWPHGKVAQAYGVFNEDAGLAVRGTFLIDKDGVVRFAEMNGPGEGRDANDWRAAIKSL